MCSVLDVVCNLRELVLYLYLRVTGDVHCSIDEGVTQNCTGMLSQRDHLWTSRYALCAVTNFEVLEMNLLNLAIIPYHV